MLVIVMLACALLCFVFGALWVPQTPPRPNLISLGLAFYILSLLVQLKH
jgi:hypothetical protein